MKKLLFIFLPILLLYGCSNDEILIENEGGSPATRVASSDVYSFEIYGGGWAPYYQYDCKGNLVNVTPGIVSYYRGDSGETEPILPEILTKPVWVDSVAYHTTAYNGMFACYIYMENNTSSSERRGEVILKQPISDKTLSLPLLQESSSNEVTIKVNKTYKNQYGFIATTTYPVKGEMRIRIPFIVYNDGGELSHNAVIVIAKGEKTGSYLMDWNASPLVAHHGDIKGYRLYEGDIWGEDNIRTYSFVRYW